MESVFPCAIDGEYLAAKLKLFVTHVPKTLCSLTVFEILC